MRVEVIMPQMGESIVEGQIVEWKKAIGDTVKRDEDVFILSTDKVDAEVPSPADGVLVEILYQAGDTVEVGTIVGWLETDPDAARTAPAESTPAPEAAPEKPKAESKAADATPAAPAVEEAAPEKPKADTASSDEASVESLRKTRSTPLVRRMAREHGITDLSVITGTGVSGRVTKQDLLTFIEGGGARKAASAATASSKPASSTPSTSASADRPVPGGYRVALERPPRVHVYDGDRVEPMSRMRASIVENMLQARRTTAHCHTVWEADVTPLVKARKTLGAEFQSRGAKLTFTPFFVAAVVEGLRAYPLMNAAIDGDSIVYRSNMNIGVAAAVEEGLIVPVVKQADTLNLFGLAKAVNDLASRSKNRQLKPQDVSDGTFTISNAGVFGSLFGIPILVQPQVGILGIGGIKKRVMADDDDNIRVRSVVTMCLTFDHRLIDGETADGFMRVVTSALGRVPA